MTEEEEVVLARGEALLEQLAHSAYERAERRLKRDDRSAILEAVFNCANSGVPLPQWASNAFVQAYLETVVGPPLHASWDSVFGKPHRKHRKLNAEFKASKFQWHVYAAVLEMRKARSRRTDVFPAVARRFERFGIGEALCRKYFRRVDKMVRREPARIKSLVDAAIRHGLSK